MKINDQADTGRCSLLACQISISQTLNKKDRQQQVDSMAGKIDRALSQRHADLVVLPELSTIEYSRGSFEQLGQLAEELDGSTVEVMRELALRHRSAIVFGMPRRSGEEYFISQIAIAANGEILTCYDKLHICQYGASMEKEFFQSGDHVSTFSISGFRFAPIICYDIRIPELSRSLALKHQVDCLLHCGAYYRDESFTSWHAFVTTRAMENQLYLLSLNRAGQQYGNSIFCLPWMDEKHVAVEFAAQDEDFRYLELSRSSIQEIRKDYTFLQDRLGNYDDLPGSGN